MDNYFSYQQHEFSGKPVYNPSREEAELDFTRAVNVALMFLCSYSFNLQVPVHRKSS